MPNNSDVLHHKIKAARNHAKMTQQQLADVLDDRSIPENFGKTIKDIEAISHKLGELTPDQIKAVRNIIDSY